MAERAVLVTGAGGFIGSSLVDDQLARGRKVVALDMNVDRLRHLVDNPDCEIVEGDIRNRGLAGRHMKDVDTVFHLASAHLEVSESESYFREINVDAVKMLLERARENGVRRFVHCSSVGVYGPLESLPADEQTECHPEILYEKTKLEGENAVREAVRSTGLSAVILRPAWVYGPRCPRTLKLFRAIRKKRFFMVGRGENLRHPIFISDMLEAFDLAAGKEGVDGGIFIIAGSEPVKLRSLVEEITVVQEMDFSPVTVPFALMTPVCMAVEGIFRIGGREPPFSTRSLKFFTESSAFDISRARAELGFQPAVPLRDGLERTYEQYVANGLM